MWRDTYYWCSLSVGEEQSDGHGTMQRAALSRLFLMIPVFGILSRVFSFSRTSLLTRSFRRQSHSTQLTPISFGLCPGASFSSGSLSAMRMDSTDADELDTSNKNDSKDNKSPPPPKHHTITVCMVPPPSAESVWADVTKARTELRDPGLFRWPPHVNILYPFIQINDADSSVNDEIMNKLRNATKQCQPFHVALDTLGTFGGKSRGVLWLYPRSYHGESLVEEEPLVRLQAMLEQAFPTCTDQRPNGQYTPHMTLSHFPSLEEAQNAQLEIESWWPNDVSFFIEEIYLLQRKGDSGQFIRVATVSLGHHDSSGIQLHDPPEPFPAMPLVEEDWVKQERMQLKERRNRSWKGKQRRRGRRRPSSDDSRSSTSRSTDTPEVIAAKRAQRKAKREQLQRERLEQETESDD